MVGLIVRSTACFPWFCCNNLFERERYLPMKRITSLSLAVLTVLCLVVATERRAWGYIDPGTGLVALQSIASVAAACSYFMRRRIRSLFGTGKEKIAATVHVEVVADQGTPRKAV